MSDADASRCNELDRLIRHLAVNSDRTASYVDSVVLAGNSESQRKLTGARCELVGLYSSRPSELYLIQSLDRLNRANKNASGPAGGLRHQIQAFIHSVYQIYISMPRRSKDDSGSFGKSSRGMGCQVVFSEVSLGLYNDSGSVTVPENFTE
jgi:hypothetical protein